MTLPSFFPLPTHASSSSTPPQLPSFPSTSPKNRTVPSIATPPTSSNTASPTPSFGTLGGGAILSVAGATLLEIELPNPVGVLLRAGSCGVLGVLPDDGVPGLETLFAIGARRFIMLGRRNAALFLSSTGEAPLAPDAPIPPRRLITGLGVSELPRPWPGAYGSGESYRAGLFLRIASERASSSSVARGKRREAEGGAWPTMDLRREVGREVGWRGVVGGRRDMAVRGQLARVEGYLVPAQTETESATPSIFLATRSSQVELPATPS